MARVSPERIRKTNEAYDKYVDAYAAVTNAAMALWETAKTQAYMADIGVEDIWTDIITDVIKPIVEEILTDTLKPILEDVISDDHDDIVRAIAGAANTIASAIRSSN